MATTLDVARLLASEHETRHPFHSIAGELPAQSTECAYDVQTRLVELLRGSEGAPVGYKIGLTTRRMQEMCGLTEPIAGHVLARRVHRSPARVELHRCVRLGIESELCLQMARDVPPRDSPYGLEEIRDCVATVAAAFELVEDRGADYARLEALSLIADNSWNAGVVLGEAVAPPARLDALEGTLLVNGTVLDGGRSRDVLGNPLAAVQWLIGHLHRRGRYLRAGELVMTGSIVLTKFPSAGDRYRFELADLPVVEVAVLP